MKMETEFLSAPKERWRVTTRAMMGHSCWGYREWALSFLLVLNSGEIILQPSAVGVLASACSDSRALNVDG